MRWNRHVTTTVALAAFLLSIAGCATGPPPTFYLLDWGATDQLPGVERGIAVGVGPIEIPEYLNRPQIVTRATRNKLDLSESHQWAEPLKDSVSRVIAVNLAQALDTNRVYILPRRQRTPLDYKVSIDVARFDGSVGGDAVLGVRWTLFGKDGKEMLLTKVSIITEPAESGQYDALVAAKSHTLEILSQEIATAIASHR